MHEPLPGPYQLVADIPGRRMMLYSDDGWRIAVGTPEHMSGDPVALRATFHLLAAAWELREALETIEWSRHGVVRGDIQPICAACDASQGEGHAAGCSVDVALGKAGRHGGRNR